jgi:hypothetical protein
MSIMISTILGMVIKSYNDFVMDLLFVISAVNKFPIKKMLRSRKEGTRKTEKSVKK